MNRGASPGRRDPSPMRTLKAFEAVFNNFRFYTEMSCYLVPAESPDQWICLQPDLKHFHIKDFEAAFGKTQQRRDYNQHQFNRLAQGQKPVCSVFSGFHDYFVPVLREGKCAAFLVSGIFLKTIPARKDLERQWELWSGKKPLPGDADFKRFVSTALSAPLLDGPLAAAHLELLQMVASLVSGGADPDKISDRADLLNRRVFTKWKLDVRWPWKALGLETAGTNRAWPEQRLGDIDRAVAKIKRVPQAAIALLLEDAPGRFADEVDAMIRQKHLERAGFFLARRLEETVSFPLWDEGLVFLTSPRPGASTLQAKWQLGERARVILEKVGSRFGGRAHAGIGSIVAAGDGLYPSCRQAFQALQWAVHRNGKFLFYDEIAPLEIKPPAKDRPWPSAPRLVEACLKGLKAEEAPAVDDFLKEVLHHTAERPDLIRVHLVDALALYADSLEKKLLLPTGRLSGLLKEWLGGLEKSRSAREMAESFRQAIRSFKEFSLQPSAAEGKSAVMELQSKLGEHFRSPLNAGQVARQLGISRSTLHRYVRKWMGMGFQEYLQKVRLEEAQGMLRGSRHSVARIARECGFSSSGYFIRVFKKNTGKTPQQFRHPPDKGAS